MGGSGFPLARLVLADGAVLDLDAKATRASPATLGPLSGWIEDGGGLAIRNTADSGPPVTFVGLWGVYADGRAPILPGARPGLPVVADAAEGALWIVIPPEQRKAVLAGVPDSAAYHILLAGETLLVSDHFGDLPDAERVATVAAWLAEGYDLDAFNRWPLLRKVLSFYGAAPRDDGGPPGDPTHDIGWWMTPTYYVERTRDTVRPVEGWVLGTDTQWGDGLSNGHYDRDIAFVLKFLLTGDPVAYKLGLEICRQRVAMGMNWSGPKAGAFVWEKGWSRRGIEQGAGIVRRADWEKQWIPGTWAFRDLSGDPLLTEAIELHGQWLMSVSPTAWQSCWGARRPARMIEELLVYARRTGEQMYLDRALAWGRDAIRWQRADGTWANRCAPGTEKPWQQAQLVESLRHLSQIDGSADLAQAASLGAHAIAERGGYARGDYWAMRTLWTGETTIPSLTCYMVPVARILVELHPGEGEYADLLARVERTAYETIGVLWGEADAGKLHTAETLGFDALSMWGGRGGAAPKWWLKIIESTRR